MLTDPYDAELIATGSIIDHVSKSYDGHILGSGLISDMNCHFPRAKIWAVRGPLTADRLGLDDSVSLGDPGLLVKDVFSPTITQEYRLGIIPHLSDIDNHIVNLISHHNNNNDVHLIDVRNTPGKVISEIAKCEHILSSSLHGLIVSDALGIPNIRVIFGDNVYGDGFKYDDYYMSIHREHRYYTPDGSESLSELTAIIGEPYPAPTATIESIDSAMKKFANYYLSTPS